MNGVMKFVFVFISNIGIFWNNVYVLYVLEFWISDLNNRLYFLFFLKYYVIFNVWYFRFFYDRWCNVYKKKINERVFIVYYLLMYLFMDMLYIIY